MHSMISLLKEKENYKEGKKTKDPINQKHLQIEVFHPNENEHK